MARKNILQGGNDHGMILFKIGVDGIYLCGIIGSLYRVYQCLFDF